MYDNNGTETNTNPYPQRSGMARASFTLGILAVMLCSIFYIALPCGGLAILCALLSRTEKSGRMDPRCRFAVISGLVGIAATLLLTGTSMYRVFTDPQQRALLEYYLQAYTGDSSIKLEDLFPFLADEKQDEPGTQISDEPQKDNAYPDGNFLNDDIFPGQDFFFDSPQSLKDGEEVFL